MIERSLAAKYNIRCVRKINRTIRKDNQTTDRRILVNLTAAFMSVQVLQELKFTHHLEGSKYIETNSERFNYWL